ncbi:hypothetical protein FHS72_000597 [Loktanella ponticola]|uniref:Orotidine 5'-phosphate decarboxylase n=1 Tax=Yoonia ponticola TaxID=1524255 RepID=A0A7W9BI88_9RHOB|nr:orotidine 5'-phosphate decarboxylase [Yoonia ponticola]MBB5720990.1 hypothetical protein [Yoonia ponticola]
MNISLGDVHYNATAGAFEARVDIAREEATYRYPCSVAGPVTMDMAHVRESLKRRAVHMSDSSPDLLSHN